MSALFFEALAKPIIHARKQSTGVGALTSIAPKPRRAYRCPQLPGFCLLFSRNCERPIEMPFRLPDIALGYKHCDIASRAMDVRFAPGQMPTAFIMSPRSLTTLGGLLDLNRQPRFVQAILENIPFISTSQIPNNLTVSTSTDCSEIYAGDFTKLAFVIRNDRRSCSPRKRSPAMVRLVSTGTCAQMSRSPTPPLFVKSPAFGRNQFGGGCFWVSPLTGMLPPPYRSLLCEAGRKAPDGPSRASLVPQVRRCHRGHSFRMIRMTINGFGALAELLARSGVSADELREMPSTALLALLRRRTRGIEVPR